MEKINISLAGDSQDENSFVRKILGVINSVRANPKSIVKPLQEQMHQVDNENVLNVPGRDPI